MLDDCNVCGGDGSTCNAVEGTKDLAPKQGILHYFCCIIYDASLIEYVHIL